MESLSIQSSNSIYNVDFFEKIQEMNLESRSKQIFIVDSNVYELYKLKLEALIGNSPCLRISPNEEEKSLIGVEKICNFLQENKTDKETTLVAIGGGIVQDLVTFCAHVYFRGLNWVLIPSTLLSMADSCIGAKAGINLNKFKNQLGAFHAPQRILICSEFLSTLEELELKSGYGEILKLSLIKSWTSFKAFQSLISEQGFHNDSILDFIRQSLETKKTYIEEDEFDTGIRRILNYGHSFGHALESISEVYIPHGIAITWGMSLANFFSYKSTKLSEAKFTLLDKFIKENFLNGLEIKVDSKKLLEAVSNDKKVINNQVNMVLLKDDDSFEIKKTDINSKMEQLVNEFKNL